MERVEIHVRFSFKSLPIFPRFFTINNTFRTFKAKSVFMIQGTGNFPDARVLEKLIFGETAAQLRSALKYMSNFHSKPCQYFPVLFAKNDTFRIFKAKLYLMT